VINRGFLSPMVTNRVGINYDKNEVKQFKASL
jgi:hypothetical protein